MTDKSKKPEERNLAIRSNRGSAPVTMAQKPVPGPGLLGPPGTAHYSLHAEIPSIASTMHYGHMLHPPFGISLHNLSGSSVQPPPVISSDLGPPIFMPSLNLGVPNTSNSSSMSAAGLPPSNARPTTPTLSQSSSDLNASCHNSFPSVMAPAASQFSNTSVLRSSSLPPHPLTKPSTPPIQGKPAPPTLNSLKNPKTPTTVGANPVGGCANSSYPVNVLKQVRRQSSPSAGAHSPLGSVGNSDILALAFSSTSGVDVGSPVGIIKPALSITPTSHVVELTSGHASRPSRPPVSTAPHTQIAVGPPVGTVGKVVGGGKNADDGKIAVTGSSQSDGLPPSMDGSGSSLICLEGMAPLTSTRQTVVTTSATPTSSTTTTVMDLRAERPPQLSTSSIQTYHSQQPLLLTSDAAATFHFHPTTTSSAPAIPRPEAISKNIIIPATNLTGRDIANLTSSAASSAATSPVVESLPGFDRLPSGDGLAQQANTTLQSDPSSSESVGSTGGALGRVPALVHAGHSQSPPPNSSHPTSVIQHDSTLSSRPGMAHTHGLQTGNNSSSPRPSILRRRPHESGRSLDGAVSPLSSQSSTRLLSGSLPGAGRGVTVPESSPGLILQENHLRENSDFVVSPRKRPRKQQFEAMADSCFPQSLQSNEDSSAIDAAEASFVHNSIVANERLPGPLPLRNKVTLGDLSLAEKNPQPSTEKEIRYLAQMRRCPYPMTANCRISHRAPHHHFRRHADIKHRDEMRVLLHEVANSRSTWLRASGWKITHVSEQLSEMGDVKHDVLSIMEGLQSTCRTFLESASCCYSQEHKHHLMEMIQGNLDRSKRAVEHIEESRKILLSMLDQQPKVADRLKKYATHLPFDSTIQPFS